jgi:hypothetical protein
MARTVPLLIAGAIAGGTAVGFIAGREAPVEPSLKPAAELDFIEAENPVASGGIVTERVAAYERALAAGNVSELEAMIDRTAASPRSRARDLDLAALLARLSEIDPQRAVDFAQSAYLETPFLIQAFDALARADTKAALGSLTRVSPVAKQRSIAFALLDTLGFDSDAVEQLAAALPEGVRAGFELDALIARARIDPESAMRDALSHNPLILQNYLLPALAETTVATDPAAALALSDLIADQGARLSYQRAVMTAWADLDPEAVLAFLGTAGPAELAMSADVFATLAEYDPDRLLAAAGTFPPAAGASARRAVIQTLAQRDPEAALAILDAMPPGRDRESMLSAVALAYGRQNPDLALAWATSLSPPSQQAVQSVLRGISLTDTSRAIDLYLEELANPSVFGSGGMAANSMLSLSAIMPILSANAADMRRLVNGLLELDNPQLQGQLSAAVSIWANRDSDAAADWALANADRLDASALRSVAQRMAAENPELALSTLDRLPAPQRDGWIQGVVSVLALTDIDRTRTLVEQLQGQPAYGAAYATMTQAMARTDPEAAARMLANASSDVTAQSVAPIVAMQWASRDPEAAANWALGLENAQMQANAIGPVAAAWAARDAEAAQRWLFGLEIGPARDRAADGYLSAAAQAGLFEPRLLDAYSSDQARQQGASRAAIAIARSDPSEAERLLDAYVTNPAIRAQTEAQLAAGSTALGSTPISGGGPAFLQ